MGGFFTGKSLEGIWGWGSNLSALLPHSPRNPRRVRSFGLRSLWQTVRPRLAHRKRNSSRIFASLRKDSKLPVKDLHQDKWDSCVRFLQSRRSFMSWFKVCAFTESCRALLLQLYEPGFDRITYQSSGVVNIQAVCQQHPVRLNRLDADLQDLGNLFCRMTVCD